MVELRGIEPQNTSTAQQTGPLQNATEDKQKLTLAQSAEGQREQIATDPGQKDNSSAHPKRVPEEYQLPEDLAEVVTAWPDLTAEVKAEMFAVDDPVFLVKGRELLSKHFLVSPRGEGV